MTDVSKEQKVNFNKYFNPKVFGLILAVGISAAIYIFRDQIAQLAAWGYLGLFLLNVFGSATLFMPTPLFLTAFAAASVLNPWLVTVVAATGSSIGEITGYVAGLGGTAFIDGDGRTQKIRGWMSKYGAWALFVLAAIPNPLFDVAGLIAGATKVPLLKFLLAIWAGKLVKFGAIVLLGFFSVKILG